MKNLSRIIPLQLCLALIPTWGHAQDSGIPEADMEKMRQAMPEKAHVASAAPRRVLIFTLCRGFRHGSIPHGSAALKLLGEATGAYEAVVSDDISVFEPPSLAAFDAVIMNNTTGEIFTAPGVDKMSGAEKDEAVAREQRLKESLLSFVAGGKGLVGVHAATDCLYKWTDYGDMLGAYFWGHPWNEDVTLKLDDPGHPLCRAFKGQPFKVADEIYQFREPYSRDKLRVLLSIDADRTNMNKGDKLKREDSDFAVSWVRSYGRGRVFYCSLGHRNEIFWNPAVLCHYLDGIQYALGDLACDATPSADLSTRYLAQSRERADRMGTDALFAELRTFEMGGNTANVGLVAGLVVKHQTDKRKRGDIEKRLLDVIEADSTLDSKRFACRQLLMVGSDAAAERLLPLLSDAEMSDMARYALERIPGRNVDRVLCAALPEAEGLARVGIINSLGARRAEHALPALAAELEGQAPDTVTAAADALGRIGGTKAAETLLRFRTNAAESCAANAVDAALLQCADGLAQRRGLFSGRARKRAAHIYRTLTGQDAASHIRAAAFRSRMLMLGDDSVPATLVVLRQEGPHMRAAAAQVIRELESDTAAATFAEALPRLPRASQVIVLAALGDRGDRTALPHVLAAAESESEAVQLAALRALVLLGDAAVVGPIARLAATAEDRSPVQQAARRVLARVTADDVTQSIAEAIDSSPTVPVARQLIWALGARNASAATPTLLRSARSGNGDVRKEALKALADVAQPEHLPNVTRLLIESDSAADRSAAESIIVAVARKLTEELLPPACLTETLDRDIPTAARCGVLAVLGRIGVDGGLPALYTGLEHPESDVRKAAIKALADWPTNAPMAKLRHVSRTSDDLIHRVLALRGYAAQLAMPSDRPMRDTLAMYTEALKLAQTAHERKSLLGGLGDVVHPDALALAESLIPDKEVQAEALLAASKIVAGLEGAAMKLSASHGKGTEKNAVDGARDTRWTTGTPMRGGEWLDVDLGYETDVKEICLDAGPVGSDWPRGYEVTVSTDREQWGDPIVTGQGKEKIFTIELPDVYGRYIRIKQTGHAQGNFWSVAEMRINGRPRHIDEEQAILDRKQWKVSASQKNEDAPNAIDGDLENRWGTGRAMKAGDWFAVDMGEEKTVYKIMLNAAKSGSDYPRGYEVYISSDGQDWLGPIAKGEGKNRLTTITVLPRRGRHVKIVETQDHHHNWWSIYDMTIIAE